jgi:hypothetical protein
MDNKKLVKATTRICDLMDQTSIENPLRTFLLDSLVIFMTVDGQIIKAN